MNFQKLKTGQKNRSGKDYFVILVLIGAAFALGFGLGSRKVQVTVPQQIQLKNTTPPSTIEVDFSLFWDVWQRVTTQHLERGKLDPKKIVEGAISGLVGATDDPYSAFLTAEQNVAAKQELAGIYEGVGIQIGAKEEKIVVIAPLAGTPAETGGVKANDAILKIDEKPTQGMSLPEAVSLIRGQAGTKVKLTLQRGEGQPFELELARAKITVKSVEVKFDGQIGILKLSRFGDSTNSEWDAGVLEVLSRNPAGLILDLRNNPGGFLSSAVHIAQDFVRGRIVGQKDSSGAIQFFEAQRAGKLTKIPMVVVVNSGTASAAEILAGAMQEKKRAKLVGEVTFGKGTVQDAQELAGGAGLHLTIAKWLLPSGKDINGTGLAPDFEVKAGEGDVDVQLEKAKEVLRGIL